MMLCGSFRVGEGNGFYDYYFITVQYIAGLFPRLKIASIYATTITVIGIHFLH